MKKILVTGSAGFIGFHLCQALLQKNFIVLGVDNLNDYYDVSLKESRNIILHKFPNYQFLKIDISNQEILDEIFLLNDIDAIVNLAAQAGVQYSIENPRAYIDSNIIGFANILEIAKELKVQHLVYASSSSVYGLNAKSPFKESDNVDHPLSLYAATKKSNELMAHSYSYIHNIPTTGLRFFTVYGPWGRPDMALFKFAKAITTDTPIQLNNYGNHARDFTFIDDIVSGICNVLIRPPVQNTDIEILPSNSSAPWKILNIGRGQQVPLMSFIEIIEEYFQKELKKNLVPLQVGDVENTFCDTSILQSEYEYQPTVDVTEGVTKFLDWYVDFYDINIKSVK
jgi:UDP-glucuronate 4-epimerase